MRHRYGGRHHVLGLQRPRGAGDREQLAAEQAGGDGLRVRWARACVPFSSLQLFYVFMSLCLKFGYAL